MPTSSSNTKGSITRTFSLTKTAWIIDQPRRQVEKWLDQEIFWSQSVFRVDAGMDHPQVRFTEDGVKRAMRQVLIERLRWAPTMSEGELIKWLHDVVHSMFARLDQVR